MKRFLLPAFFTIVLLGSGLAALAQPTLSNAKATSLTNIQLTFGTAITAIPGTFTAFTFTGGVTCSAATINAGKIDLTVAGLGGTNFTCASCLTIAAGGVSDAGGNNAAINSQPVADAIPPTLVITRNAVTLGSIGGTTDNTVSFNLAFSEVLTTGTIAFGDVTVNNTGTGFTALSAGSLVNQGDNQNFTLTVTGITGDGTIAITVGPTINDAATVQNPMAGAVGPSPAFTIDNTPPPTPAVPIMVAGSDTGSSNSDENTSDNTPDFTMTGTAGLLLQLLDGGTPVDNNPSATGAAETLTASTLSDGAHNMAARTTDAAGNTATSATLPITIDTTPPPVPAVPNMTAGTDSGISSTDDNTNDNTPDFTVTGTSGLKLDLLDGVTVVGTIASASGGSQTITATTLSDGVHSITARTTDVAGNVTSSTALSVTIDTANPTAPSVPDLTAGTDHGPSSTDDITNDNTPDFQVTGTAGLRLEILDGVTVVGTIASASGALETITTSALSAGVRSITARTTDIAGNVASSTALSVTIDTTAPSAPTAPNMTAGTDSGSSSTDNNTNDNTPDFQMTGSAGLVLDLMDGVTIIGTIASASGALETITPGALTDGVHSITARTMDLAGNTASSGALSTTIDTTDPAIPSIPDLLAASDLGSSNSDNITSDNTPTFTGTHAENGVTVTIFDSATPVGSAVVGGGAYSVTTSALSEGAHTISASATDVAGNTGTASGTMNVTIDTTPPTAPSVPDLNAGSDSGSSSTDNNTNDNTPTFDVTGTATFKLEILDGITVVATTASATGALQGLTTSVLADGTHATITARTTDVAGNTASSAALSVVIDTTPPPVPGTPDLTNGSDLGTANNDNITKDNTPDFSTSGTSGFKLELLDGVTVVGTIASASGGGQTITSSALSDAVHTMSTRTTDVAGNTTVSGSTLNVTIDTTPPTISGPAYIFFNACNKDATTGNPHGRETVIFSITEPIALANNALVSDYDNNSSVGVRITDGSNDVGIQGNSSGGNGVRYYTTLAPAYASPITFTNAVQIISNDPTSNWNYTAPISQFSYVAGGNLFDIAGNEFNVAATNVTNGSSSPPTVSPNTMTLYPRFTNPEKIVFTLDAELNLAEGATVNGFSVVPAVPFTATYSDKGNTNIITLLAAANLTFTLATTVSYTQASGDAVGINGAELGAIALHAVVNETDAPNITLVSVPAVTMKIGDVVTATLTTDDDDGDDPILVAGNIDGFPISGLTSTNGTTKTVQFTVTEGGGDVALAATVPLSITLKDNLNNTAAAYTTGFAAPAAIDANSPKVLSINRLSATTAWSTTTFGTSASSVVFRVTFNENIKPASIDINDFSMPVTGSVSGATITNIAAFSGTSVYDITVGTYSGTGTLGLNYDDNDDVNSITDVAGNPTRLSAGVSDDDFTGQKFSIVLPEPTNYPTAFACGTSSPTQLQVTWTNPVAPATAATHLLILAKENGVGTFATVQDGALVTAEESFGDGNGAAIIDMSTLPTSYTFSNMLSGKQYDFIIYPYTLSANNAADNTDYKGLTGAVPTGGNPTVSCSTSTGSTGSLTAGTTAAPATITSLTTAFGSKNFTFKITDDGLTPGIDNAKTRFDQIIISAKTGESTISDWSAVIAQAELRDITENAGSPILTTTIGTNSITFTGITNGTNNIGALDDNEVKEYELRIRLKTSLPVDVDNQRFEFVVNPASFTGHYIAGSSTIGASEKIDSDPGNADVNNTVTVTATALAFKTQPSPTNPFVLSNLVTTPIVEYVDANGNRDINHNTNANVTNTSSIPMNPGAVTPLVLTASGGVITFPAAFQYTDQGTGTLTVTDGALNSNAGAGFVACSAVTVSYSSTSTITAGTGVTPILGTATNAAPFTFTIKDDNGAAGDGSPTRITTLVLKPGGSNTFGTWTDLIASATLTDDNATPNTIAGVVNAGDITFSAIPVAVNALGYIADNATKVYTLNIVFQNPLLNGLAATADNKRLVFSVTQGADVGLNVLSSQIAGGQTTNSGAGNGLFTVITTLLKFTTEPLPNYLVNTTLATTTAPIVEAVDTHGNRDTDYGFPVAAPVVTSAAIGLSSPPTTIVSGIINNFGPMKYTAIGNGQLTVTPSVAAANALVPAVAVSNSAPGTTVSVGTATQISAGTGVGTFSSDLVANTTAPGGTAFTFTVTDDGGAPPDDGNPTLISQITITQGTGNTIGTWSDAILSAQLSDAGGHTLTASSITATSIVFSSIPFGSAATLGYVTDSNPKVFTLKIQLRTTLLGNLPITIDGMAFGFEVKQANVITDPNGTNIIPGLSSGAGTATDVVTVVASKLNFLTTNPSATPVAPYNTVPLTPFATVPSPIFPTGGSINTPFVPVLGVEAVDANKNRDHDFTETITSVAINSSLTTTSNPSGAFTLGVLAFPAAFQYTSGNNQDGAVTIKTASFTANYSQPGANTSLPINIFSSSDSYVYFDPSFVYSPLVNIVNQQAGSLPNTITVLNTSQSAVLAQFILSDGGAAQFEATASHTPAVSDADGAFTRISSITLSVTNPGDLRTLALYDNSGNKIGTEQTAASSVTFSGLSIQAADNSTTPFTIRATFQSSIAADHDLIQLGITAVVQSAGSLIYPFPVNVAYKGGVLGGDKTPVTVNKIDVTATKLVFTQNPPRYAGIGEEVPHGLLPKTNVVALDALNNLDLDFDAVQYGTRATVTSPAALATSTFNWAAGVLDLSTLQYSGTGNGTLTVNTTIGLPPGPPVVAQPSAAVSSVVDVIDVTTSIATSGVIATTNLAGGSVNKFIFGVTFSAPHTVTGPNHPTLQSFKILFTNPATNPFTNPRVFESSSSPLFGGPNVTTLNGKVSMQPDSVTVYFYTPRDLSAGDLTYFLEVDVAAGASGSTPTVQPYVLDNGFNAADGSYSNIVVSQGSIHANTSGQVYSFASIFPPTLTSSYPAAGQLNVDPVQPTLFLNFSVPVKSLDGQVRLYDQTTGTFTTLLTPDGTNLVNPIRFDIPPGTLQANKVYYVTIVQGSSTANGGIGVGLVDQAGNLFGGISYSGTLYFKTANPQPPQLLTTPPVGTSAPSITNISATNATINATFDQPGRAYFVVLPSGTPTPTPAQIKVGGHPSAKAQGSFAINQINPISQFGVISPTLNLAVGSTYDVWISAESYAEFSGSGSPSPVTVTPIPALPPLHFGSSAKVPKTGTISTLIASNVVTGVGTLFTSELVVGRSLFNGATFIGTISSITSNTSLTLNANASVAVTNAAFSGSGFELGAAGPTMSFTVPAPSGSAIALNNPSISICTNSYQIFNAPIMISEKSTNNFTGAGSQVFNLVLPAGFQFDVTMNGTSPKYGTLTRTGGDFDLIQPSQPLKFLGSSILQVNFINTGSGTLDNLIISGLRVLAPNSSNGNIIRLGGSGLPTISDGTSFAALSANDAQGISFTNDYSIVTFGNNQVTTIPDNFGGGTVQLTPLPPAGDFGPSSFSGQGVNVNQLSLSAVTLGSPFNITVTHTDNNGCVSTSPTQYTVYDHNTAIAILNSGGANISGVPQCIPNPNFPSLATPGGPNLYNIRYNNLPAYYMKSLVADIPAFVRKAQTLDPLHNSPQILDSVVWRSLIQNNLLVVDPNTDGKDGATPLRALPPGFHELPNPLMNPHNPSNNPWPGTVSPPGIYYYDYHFDVSSILNANSFSATIPDPYTYFVSSLTAQNHIYYRGGSLGIVELTGTFQSIANSAVVIPLIQNIEFFLPAIPLVEVGQGNMVNTTTGGISVYCQAGGPLTINGFPAASPGSSVGKFVVIDSLTSAVIYDTSIQPAITAQSNVGGFYQLTLAAPLKSTVTTSDWVTITGSNHDGTYQVTAVVSPSVFSINVPFGGFTFTGGGRAITGGFLDNGNGTASLDPSKILNNYNPIKIIYTYKENVSPCQSAATRTIQIVKNPTAAFMFQTEQVSPGVYPANAPTNQSYCVGYNIVFDGSTSINVSGAGAAIDKTNYAWTFNDPTGKDSANVLPAVPHKYGIAKPTPYDVVLNVSSYWGCPSAPLTHQVTIGDIPVVDFTFYDTIVGCTSCGVGKEKFKSVKDPSPSITISKWAWDFRFYSNGVATPNIDTLFRRYDSIHHYYAAPGIYNVKHTTTSSLFCANSATRNLVIVPNVTTSASATYLQPFNDDGKWQIYDGRNSKVQAVWGAASNLTPPSWAWGQPSGKPTMQYLIDSGYTAPNNTLWVTNLTGTYKQDEHSALYSPVFNIFQLNRPMVSFNAFAELGSDAVVLQFSVDSLNIADSTKVWIPLGSFLTGTNISSGVDWFNKQGLGVSPGDQPLNPLGWTDRGGSVKTWLESKHSLDTLVRADIQNHGRRVYFRFALASSSSSTPLEGFAIDNFRLGNRTRTVLVENFKNTGNTAASEKQEAQSLAAFNTTIVGTELIKLNYDVGFPGQDPFNQDNAADPSARALFYGISSTPLARLDGKNEVAPSEAPFSTWGKHYYDLRSLQLAQAKILILPNTGNVNDSLPGLITQNGEFKFKVVVIPIDTLQANTILQVAIVEDSITLADLTQVKPNVTSVGSDEQAFQYVVKKLLPNAAGTRFNVKYDSVNLPPPFEFELVPDPSRFYGPSVGNISIVAFLQDADTKEVWQTEAVRGLDNPVVTTTGVTLNSEQINIYPNPASSQFVIELPQAPKQPVTVRMMDQVGKLVHESTIDAGVKSKTVATRDLAEGMYILQIDAGNGNMVRSKIMVIHTQ